MSSRVIKALNLLHILSDTITSEDDYIKMDLLKQKLKTDDRNIRNIVRLIREDLGINIISKTGPYGGYRLNRDIYKYLYGISFYELDNVLDEVEDLIMESKRSNTFKKQSREVINKTLKRESKKQDSISGKLLYDIDYLNFMEEAKRTTYAATLNLSSDLLEPFHVHIAYRDTSGMKKYNVLCLDNPSFGGYENFIVLDLDTKQVRFLDLRFVQEAEIVYGNYDYQPIFDSIENRQYDQKVSDIIETIKTKLYIKVIVKGNLSKETYLMVHRVLGNYIIDISNNCEFYISRSKIAQLYSMDILELEGSIDNNDNFLWSEEEMNLDYKIKYNMESPIVLDQENYNKYYEYLNSTSLSKMEEKI